MEKLLFIGLISRMIGALYTGLTLSNKPICLFAGISLSIGASNKFFLRAWMKRRRLPGGESGLIRAIIIKS
jgi:hypothetical protein